MDPQVRARLATLLGPLYDNPEAGTGFDEVERIEALARTLRPDAAEDSMFTLLILFHRLGRWLAHPGNIPHIVSASDGALQPETVERLTESLLRLDTPRTDIEKVVASAIAIESAGVRGFLSRVAGGQRNGRSVRDIAIEECQAGEDAPSWMPRDAAAMLSARRRRAQAAARALLEELELRDLSPPQA